MKRLEVLVVVVAIFLTACGQGAPLPTSTSTPIPVLTPTRLGPTATPVARASVKEWKGVYIGMPTDDVLKVLSEGLRSEQVGSDAEGLIVEWVYEDATLVMKRWEIGGIACYRVAEIRLSRATPAAPTPTKMPTATPTPTLIPPTPVPYAHWHEIMTSAIPQAETWISQIDSDIIKNYQEQSSCPLAEQIHVASIELSVDLSRSRHPDSWNCKRANEELHSALVWITVAVDSMLGYCREGDSFLGVASIALDDAREALSSGRHYYDMCAAE